MVVGVGFVCFFVGKRCFFVGVLVVQKKKKETKRLKMKGFAKGCVVFLLFFD